MNPRNGSYDSDLGLVRSVLGGSIQAWHGFIDRYTGLLHAVIAKYISDRDEIRTVYVEILVELRRGKLGSYKGNAALSTWLVPVARSIAVDHLRRLRGRRQVPREVRKLGSVAMRIFELRFQKGLSLEALCHSLGSADPPLPRAQVLEILSQVESRLGRRALRSLEYRSHPSAIGETSARLLEFLDSVRPDLEEQADRLSPEYPLLESEARRTVERVMALVEELPAEEREVILLRFGKGKTAKQISRELGNRSPRGIYSLLERAVERLRRRMVQEPGLGEKLD